MRNLRYILILVASLLSVTCTGQWVNGLCYEAAAVVSNPFVYYRSMSIDHTQVPADQTNFTLTISLTENDLRTSGNGGEVQNTQSVNGVTIPTDVVFCSSNIGSPLSSLLPFEINNYDPVTGKMEAHVQAPAVSSSSNTVIYMAYHSGSTTTPQGGSLGSAWDANYVCVIHFDGTNSTGLQDWSGHSNGGTATAGVSAVTGKIGGGVSVNQSGAAQGVQVGDNFYHMTGSVATQTVTMWWNSNNISSSPVLYDGGTGGSLNDFDEVGTSTSQWWGYGGTFRTVTVPSMSTGTWYAIGTVKSATGNNGSFYQNGVLQSTSSGSFGDPSNTGTSLLGNYHAGTNSPVLTIDEFTLSKVARAGSWITAHENNDAGPGTFSVGNFITYGAKTSY